MTSARESQQNYAAPTYRSSASMAGGVLLLALALGLGGDAVLRGEGRVPWVALAGMLLAVPLVVAFTVRPVVSAGVDRLVVRNPFRTITAPWAAVEAIRAGYSTELFAGGRKYQVWALPVSLRARKKAVRRGSADETGEPVRAWADQAVAELRDRAEKRAADEAAQGEVTVRWAYEILAPAAAGAVALAALLATG